MNAVVIDASVAVYAAFPNPKHERAVSLLEDLIENELSILVPHLWFCEVTTGIRKSMIIGGVSPETALKALKAVLALPVNMVEENAELYLQAYQWAERLGHLAVYDAVYVALAEQVKADFYTADQGLFNRCREIGLPFVKRIE